MAEKSLRVRVAEAIGWTEIGALHSDWGTPPPGTRQIPPGGEYPQPLLHGPIPHYGEDSPEGWAATGPLLQRFGHVKLYGVQASAPLWVCAVDDGPPHENLMAASGNGRSACEAIANCVLAEYKSQVTEPT